MHGRFGSITDTLSGGADLEPKWLRMGGSTLVFYDCRKAVLGARRPGGRPSWTPGGSSEGCLGRKEANREAVQAQIDGASALQGQKRFAGDFVQDGFVNARTVTLLSFLF